MNMTALRSTVLNDPEQNVPKTKRPRYVGTLWSLFCFASRVWFYKTQTLLYFVQKNTVLYMRQGKVEGTERG